MICIIQLKTDVVKVEKSVPKPFVSQTVMYSYH